jgi:DNA-binding Lrp family transcriptional regulator
MMSKPKQGKLMDNQVENSNIHFIKFEDNTRPSFKITGKKELVNYGAKNDYPFYLLDMFNSSAKNNAICTQKAAYIAGQGWAIPNLVANRTGETFDSILSKIALDVTIFGGFTLQIIWNRAFTGIAEVYHLDFSKGRKNITGEKYYYSNNWEKYRPDVTEYPMFKQVNDKRDPIQILYYQEYRPQQETYPLPDYMGAMKWIELDTEVANFHLNNVKNNFWGGALISFNGAVPPENDQKIIVDKVTKKFTGSDNAGSIVVTFSDGKERAPTIDRVPIDNLDKQFDILNKTVSGEIFTGHRVTSPMLFGVKTEGQLGGRTELLEANELFQNNYVSPKQEDIEDTFAIIFTLKGIAELKIIPLEILSEADVVQTQQPNSHFKKTASKCSCHEDFDPDNNPIIQEFGKYGLNRDEYTIIEKRPMSESFLLDFLSEDEHNILKTIQDNPKIKQGDIAGRTNLTNEQVKGIIEVLVKEGLVTPENIITDDGEIEVKKPPILIETEILYSYEVDPQFGAPIIPGTRDFCFTMITQYGNKFWTRDDINKISTGLIGIGAVDVDWDVWRYRGGWYYRSDLGISQPFCRHLWFQNVVVKK